MVLIAEIGETTESGGSTTGDATLTQVPHE